MLRNHWYWAIALSLSLTAHATEPAAAQAEHQLMATTHVYIDEELVAQPLIEFKTGHPAEMIWRHQAQAVDGIRLMLLAEVGADQQQLQLSFTVMEQVADTWVRHNPPDTAISTDAHFSLQTTFLNQLQQTVTVQVAVQPGSLASTEFIPTATHL